jgi:hypothetical protein
MAAFEIDPAAVIGADEVVAPEQPAPEGLRSIQKVGRVIGVGEKPVSTAMTLNPIQIENVRYIIRTSLFTQ